MRSILHEQRLNKIHPFYCFVLLQIYAQCYKKVTPNGVTIDKCIQPSIDNTNKILGLVAGDEDCYEVGWIGRRSRRRRGAYRGSHTGEREGAVGGGEVGCREEGARQDGGDGSDE